MLGKPQKAPPLSGRATKKYLFCGFPYMVTFQDGFSLRVARRNNYSFSITVLFHFWPFQGICYFLMSNHCRSVLGNYLVIKLWHGGPCLHSGISLYYYTFFCLILFYGLCIIHVGQPTTILYIIYKTILTNTDPPSHALCI